MNEEHSKFAYLLHRAARLLTRRAEVRLTKLSLAVAQLHVLRVLKNGHVARQKDLASIAEIEQPAMAELLGRMERDGYVQRSPDPKDGRSSLFRLTASGERKVRPARKALGEAHAEALVGFSEGELATLTGYLERIVANFDGS